MPKPILLFTHVEFFQFVKDWWFLILPLVAGGWGQYKWITGRAETLAAEAKKEREDQQATAKKEREDQQTTSKQERDKLSELLDKYDERICKAEETQRNTLPAFRTLCDDFKKLEEVVKNHHEMRFTGIVVDQDRTRELYEEKLKNHTKRVDDLEKRLDKIDMKLDKILDVVMKNTN